MRKLILQGAVGIGLGGAMLATPAQAYELQGSAYAAPLTMADMTIDYGDRWDDDDDDDRWERRRNRDRGYRNWRYRGEPVYRDTRVWRGRDGRAYCRKRDGTTGLIIGGAVGAIVGREVDSRGDRSLGTILGAAGGALLGREVDRGGSRCR